ANAGFVTTDSYSALLLLGTVYFLWKFCKERTIRYFVFFTLAISISQLVKHSLFHLYVVAPICLLVYFFVAKPGPIRGGVLIRYLCIFILLSWFIINAG